MRVEEIAIKVLKNRYLCDNCLGRLFAQLLTGLTNRERGKTIRYYLAFLLDCGERVDIHPSNFYGIKFKNVKLGKIEATKCYICENFFDERVAEVAQRIIERTKGIEFESFLIGSILPPKMLAAQEEVWRDANLEWVESIKAEINREIGKLVEKVAQKRFELRNPEITAIVDLQQDKISIQIRSLYVFGKYKKLVRGIPQTKWICSKCGGKGCIACKGTGKLHPTSVQEEIESPLLKATKAKKSKFSGAGREDIDARCLDWRSFVIELIKPLKRKIALKKTQAAINKSKRVKVSGLKIVLDGKPLIRRLKTERVDKSYLAEVEFEKPIELKRLRELKKLTLGPILQRTPLRVIHRRADKLRKRSVKRISWKLVGKKKLQLKIRAESGLYIKELITGDEGRTRPSVAEVLENEPKKMSLDVIKIHEK